MKIIIPANRGKRFFGSRFIAAVVFLTTFPLFCSSAHAVEGQIRRLLNCKCYSDVLFVSPGLTLGGSFTAPPEGRPDLVLGAELSVVYVGDHQRELFGGIMTEWVYDWNRAGGRAVFAGIFGWRRFGVECGYLVDFSEQTPKHGGAVRLFATTGFINFYVRYGLLINGPDFAELGVQLKIPFPVWGL